MTIQMQNNRLASQRMDICTCGIAHTTRDLRTYRNLPTQVASVAGIEYLISTGNRDSHGSS